MGIVINICSVIWLIGFLINLAILDLDTFKECIIMFFIWPLFDIICLITITILLFYNIAIFNWFNCFFNDVFITNFN
jgi:hypothetical protein